MKIQVECYAGYGAAEELRAVTMGERRCTVVEILDRWIALHHRCFKVQADDGQNLRALEEGARLLLQKETLTREELPPLADLKLAAASEVSL
jgi:hypothetical protein